MGGEAVGLQVTGDVQETFVDGVDVDILGGDIPHIDGEDPAADLLIQLHPRRRGDVGGLQGRVFCEGGGVGTGGGEGRNAEAARPPQALRVDLLHLLHDLEEPGAAGDAVSLQGRGDGKADGLFRPALIRDDQVRGQGIQFPADALHGGVEGLQVDGDIPAFHWPLSFPWDAVLIRRILRLSVL